MYFFILFSFDFKNAAYDTFLFIRIHFYKNHKPRNQLKNSIISIYIWWPGKNLLFERKSSWKYIMRMIFEGKIKNQLRIFERQIRWNINSHKINIYFFLSISYKMNDSNNFIFSSSGFIFGSISKLFTW